MRIIETQLITPRGNQITYFTDAETGRMINLNCLGKDRITSKIEDAVEKDFNNEVAKLNNILSLKTKRK